MIRSSSLDAPSPSMISRASLRADSSCSSSCGGAFLKSRAGSAATSFARSSLYAKCSSHLSNCLSMAALLSFAKLAQITNAIRPNPTRNRTDSHMSHPCALSAPAGTTNPSGAGPPAWPRGSSPACRGCAPARGTRRVDRGALRRFRSLHVWLPQVVQLCGLLPLRMVELYATVLPSHLCMGLVRRASCWIQQPWLSWEIMM